MIGQFVGTHILKCKRMHLGPIHHYGPYYLNGTVIDNTDSYKTWALYWTTNSNSTCIAQVQRLITVKANLLRLGLIRKSFDHLDSEMLVKLFTAFVYPTLKYSNAV